MKISGLWTALCIGAALVACGSAQAGTWNKAESKHFVIYSDVDTASTQAYIKKLEAFYDLTNAFYDQMSDSILPQYGKTRFNYFATVEEFRAVKPELDGLTFNPALSCFEGFQYFSTAQTNGNLDGYTAGKGILSEQDKNLAYLFLVYGEHAQHERFDVLPVWASIGLNYYFMTAAFKDGKVTIGQVPPNITHSDNPEESNPAYSKDIIPFSDLIADKPVLPKLRDMAVYQDWSMVSYLMSDPDRRKAFFDYLKKVDGGMASSEAFAQIMDINPETFRTAMKTYAGKGIPYLSFSFKELPDNDIILTHLPNYGPNIPLIDATLQTCPTKNLGAAHLNTLQKTAPRFPNDIFVQMALARAEIGFGNPGDALPFLTQQISAEPKDHDVQLLLGRLYLKLAETGPEESRAKNYTNARTELGKAYKLNPTSAPGLYFYARAFADRPDFPNDNTMNAIDLAQNYSGHFYDMYQAELMVRRDRYEDAQALVDQGLLVNRDKAVISALQTLHDALSAHKLKSEILPLFAPFDPANS